MDLSTDRLNPMKWTRSLLLPVVIGACATSGGGSPSTSSNAPMSPNDGGTVSGDVSLSASPRFAYPANAPVATPDPRVGLKGGASVGDAGEAAWNMRLISNSPASTGFTGRGATGSDLAFRGNYAIQGNYR